MLVHFCREKLLSFCSWLLITTRTSKLIYLHERWKMARWTRGNVGKIFATWSIWIKNSHGITKTHLETCERSKSLWPKATRSMVKESTGQVIFREILIIQIGASPMELRSTDRYNYQAIPFEASQHEVSTNNQQKTISDSQPHQFRTNLFMATKQTNHLSGMLCTIHSAWLTANHQQQKNINQPLPSVFFLIA